MVDMLSLLRQARTMQEQVKQLQETVGQELFEGFAGQKHVQVVLNGKYEVKKISIDPSMLQAIEASQLEILIQAAFNQASDLVRERLKSEMSKITGGLGSLGLF